MAASLLRRIGVASTAPAAWENVVTAPAGRALVGKAVVANASAGAATIVFSLNITNGATAQAGLLADHFTLGPGEVYTEPNLVIEAGATLRFNQRSGGAAGGLVVSFHGQEVDN